tara:strand:+ start:86 stop:196 length:111 start_codon:yes stop_codon:yes gene_type:complete
MYFEKDKYSKKDIEEASEIHKNRAPFLIMESFPGTI